MYTNFIHWYVFENFNFPRLLFPNSIKLDILFLTKCFATREIIKGRIKCKRKLIIDEFQKVYFTGKYWQFSISTNWFEFRKRERKRIKTRKDQQAGGSRFSSETFEKSVSTVRMFHQRFWENCNWSVTDFKIHSIDTFISRSSFVLDCNLAGLSMHPLYRLYRNYHHW